MITYKDIRNNHAIKTYIRKADDSLNALGYTDHSFSHVSKVAETASYILKTMGYTDHEAELAAIAGFMHDIGNVVNRADHAISGAVMAFRILDNLGMNPEDIATVVTAIGNHDESSACPVNPVTSAVILADKTDARYTRVRHRDPATFDHHDRVNYSVRESDITINDEHTQITLSVKIDTEICAVLDYFEIFMERTILCKKAAEKLNLKFCLLINGQRLV